MKNGWPNAWSRASSRKSSRREQKHYLYYLTTWHEGNTLQQRIATGEHFTAPDVIAQGAKLVRAIGALHRRSIIHRDIKPANVHLGDDGELRMLDLGVAQSGLEAEATAIKRRRPARHPSWRRSNSTTRRRRAKPMSMRPASRFI